MSGLSDRDLSDPHLFLSYVPVLCFHTQFKALLNSNSVLALVSKSR